MLPEQLMRSSSGRTPWTLHAEWQLARGRRKAVMVPISRPPVHSFSLRQWCKKKKNAYIHGAVLRKTQLTNNFFWTCSKLDNIRLCPAESILIISWILRKTLYNNRGKTNISHSSQPLLSWSEKSCVLTAWKSVYIVMPDAETTWYHHWWTRWKWQRFSDIFHVY